MKNFEERLIKELYNYNNEDFPIESIQDKSDRSLSAIKGGQVLKQLQSIREFMVTKEKLEELGISRVIKMF